MDITLANDPPSCPVCSHKNILDTINLGNIGPRVEEVWGVARSYRLEAFVQALKREGGGEEAEGYEHSCKRWGARN